jgi:hypothetical protein
LKKQPSLSSQPSAQPLSDPPPRALRADSSNAATEGLPDKVNHPPHYNAGSIEVIAAIEDWKLDFHLGNVVKYVARADHKGRRLEDLRKAAWYLQRAISLTDRGLLP